MIAVEYGRPHLRRPHFFSAIFKAGLLISDKITDKLLLSNLAVIPRQPDPAPTSIKTFSTISLAVSSKNNEIRSSDSGRGTKTEGDTVNLRP